MCFVIRDALLAAPTDFVTSGLFWIGAPTIEFTVMIVSHIAHASRPIKNGLIIHHHSRRPPRHDKLLLVARRMVIMLSEILCENRYQARARLSPSRCLFLQEGLKELLWRSHTALR